MLFVGGAIIFSLNTAAAAYVVIVGIFGRGFNPDPVRNFVLTGSVLLLSATALPVIIWHVYKFAQTKISALGIGQPTLRGRIQISWNNVEQYKLKNKNNLRIIGSSGTVHVPIGIFRDQDKVRAFLLNRLSELEKL